MLSSSPVYIDIVPKPPLPEDLAGIGPDVNPISAYVPLPKFAHHRGQHTRRSKGIPQGGRITTLLQAEYVLSKQSDDNNDDINNSNDAHQSEGELLEGVEGSAPLEGVIDGMQEGSALLEGDLEVGPALLEGDEVDEGLPLEAATEEAEAFVPIESMMLRRKAAKRSLPWDLKVAELDLVDSLQQAEDIRATKKPCLETPIAISEAEDAAKTASPNVAVAPAAADVDDYDHANDDSVTEM
jgi:hypothetical protein